MALPGNNLRDNSYMAHGGNAQHKSETSSKFNALQKPQQEPIKFPVKLKPLFMPYRYKVIHGGRGSAKSWSIARALLILGASAPTRILCAREVQKSIKQSVHQLLKDQIAELGLSGFYDVLDTEIRGINGTLFSFTGLREHTADSIKSFEGYDICWVEEAHAVSKKSWAILTPTIRKEDLKTGETSEIWISFNPELDTDETWVRFVENPPPNTIVIEMNWRDNPWFPNVLEQERQHCKLTAKDDYDTIWEGKCRKAVVGAIYASEIAHAIKEGRYTIAPYNPKLKVHAIWDMGWNDAMSIIMVQKVRSELYVIDYIEESHKTLDWYAAELNGRNWNWGYDWLPHDAFHGDYKTGKTAKQILEGFGRKVFMTGTNVSIPNISIEDGIRVARMTFPHIIFSNQQHEHGGGARLFECLKRYKRVINKVTNQPGEPLHDEYSHGADAFRYLGIVAERLSNEDMRHDDVPLVKPRRASVKGMGY